MKALLRSLLLALLGWAYAFGAEAAGPFARASVDTKGPVVPGQQISLAVDVFAPNFFTSAPQFPLLDIPNAVVTLPDQRALNLNDTVDGVDYSGIRKVYAMVPQVAGHFTLPPAAIPLSYRDDNGQTVKATVAIPAISFDVAAAPGALPAFAAQEVVVSQSLDRKPETLTAGDALVRTVTIFAENTQAMMIPAPDFPAPPGVSVYRETPRLADDAHDRHGNAGSSRTERVTYVMEKPGTYQIPAASLDWYDTAKHQTGQASAPAVTATVAAAPPPTQTIAPQLPPPDGSPALDQKAKRAIALLALVVLAAAVVYALLRFVWPPLDKRRRAYLERRAQSEPASFGHLLAVLDGDDAWTAYWALGGWTKRAGFRTIADWTATVEDGRLRARIEDLHRALFAGERADAGSQDFSELRQRIVAARRAQLSAKKEKTQRSALPRLNP